MPPSHRSSGARTGDAPAGDSLARPLKIFALLAATAMQSQFAEAQKVRVTNLSDVDFGLIANPQAESRRSQNICVFSNSTGNAYSVSASGSGAGGSFSLSNGSAMLAYDVEWSNSSGQTSGTQLSPTVPLTGQSSSATHQFCNGGPASSASMTIVLRGAELSQAQEGSYSGTLTVLIAAE